MNTKPIKTIKSTTNKAKNIKKSLENGITKVEAKDSIKETNNNNNNNETTFLIKKVNLLKFMEDLTPMFQDVDTDGWFDINKSIFGDRVLKYLIDKDLDKYFECTNPSGELLSLSNNSRVSEGKIFNVGIFKINELILASMSKILNHLNSYPDMDKTFEGDLISSINVEYTQAASEVKTINITKYKIKPMNYGQVKKVLTTTGVESLKDILADLIEFEVLVDENVYIPPSTIIDRIHFIDAIVFVWLIRGWMPAFLQLLTGTADVTVSFQN